MQNRLLTPGRTRSTISGWVAALSFVAVASSGSPLTAAPCRVDLGQLAAGKGWVVVNRSVTAGDAAHKSVRFSEGKGVGLAYPEGCRFDTGVIEVDIHGRNVPGKSFVGVAFHGNEDGPHEAVYFRPFNFNAPDADHHAHAVQYISEPEFSWKRLRTEHPGVYENPMSPAVDGDAWFHAKVVVGQTRVTVYVNGSSKPLLDVQRITNSSGRMAGLWVGDDSDGEFAGLTITPDR